MVIAKLNNSNIYDGCLTYLRSELVGELPEGQRWETNSANGITNLIGCEESINEHNVPYNLPPSYYKIYFGNHFIKPTSYTLMGRRAATGNYLKGWNFFGLNIKKEWVLLSSYSNSLLQPKELRTIDIDNHGPFIGFMLKMTEPEASNTWALTIGQMEVHGYIYDAIPKIKYCTNISINLRIFKSFLFIMIL